MISWIVIMLLFWHYQRQSQLDPGVKISYIILPPPPPPEIFSAPSNNRWQSFVCISYLLNKIYHYIKIISMISWIVIMLLFWQFCWLWKLFYISLGGGQNFVRGVKILLRYIDPGVKISYDILTPGSIYRGGGSKYRLTPARGPQPRRTPLTVLESDMKTYIVKQLFSTHHWPWLGAFLFLSWHCSTIREQDK